MQFQLNRKNFNVLVLLICGYLVFSNFQFQVGQTLSFDVYGYYLYLPLYFIYGDLGIQNLEVVHELMNQYHSSHSFYQANITESGNHVLKYTMGQSILYAPFFFIGHLISFFTDYPSDGYSKPYETSVFIGGILYTLIGVYFFSKILLHFFSENIALIVLIITVFGTNYLLHNTMYGQNLMTHNTLFTCYALIIWMTLKWHESQQIKTIIYLAIVCGLSILIRPTELVCLFIPLLWNVWNKETMLKKVKLFQSKLKQIIVFSMIVFGIVSLQLIYFKIQTGSFFYLDYSGNPGEGLDLFPPHTLNTLFSFRKGWLIYTPIMIFAIVGMRSLYKRNRAVFWPIFIYFIFNLWFVSSWSNWWYAGSFSQRAVIPAYVALGISLGYFLVFLNERKLVMKTIATLGLFSIICLNLFQTIQYHFGILPQDRITKEYYVKTFGKLSLEPGDKELLSFNQGEARFLGEIDSTHRKKSVFSQDFEFKGEFSSPLSHTGQYSEVLSKDHPYSEQISAKYEDLTTKDHVWIKVSAWVYSDSGDQQFYLVTHADHKGKPYQYETLDSKTLQVPTKKWTKITYNYLTPPIRRGYNEIKAYVWLQEGSSILVDDFKMEIWESQSK